jgi:hypothetical protein
MKCPACRATVSWRQSQGASRYLCPNCQNVSQIARSYSLVLTVLGMLIAGFLAYALGARGTMLMFSALIGVHPVKFLMSIVTLQLFAPELVPTGEFRSILYQSASAGAVAVPANENGGQRETRSAAPWFRLLLNGFVLLAFVGLLVVTSGLIRLERWAFGVLPGLGTQSGPAQFPVTVRIRDDALELTNGSTGPWACTSRIGFKELPSAEFTLQAAETRTLDYGSFLDAGVPLTPDAGYWRARERVIVECLDGSRISHYVVF